MSRPQKLINLTKNIPEFYYWLGFLLADGHFSTNNRLVLGLSSKDKNHIEKFCSFLELPTTLIKDTITQKGFYKSTLAVMDTETVKYLKNKFKISNTKTKIPPDLSELTSLEKRFLSIGFIDGDGCIKYQTKRTDCILQIKCHSSWEKLLIELYGNCKINRSGYASTTITNNEILRDLKKFSLEYNLPIMERKWSKIDINRVSRCKIASDTLIKTIELLENGKTLNQCCKILNKNYSTLYNMLKRKGYYD